MSNLASVSQPVRGSLACYGKVFRPAWSPSPAPNTAQRVLRDHLPDLMSPQAQEPRKCLLVLEGVCVEASCKGI